MKAMEAIGSLWRKRRAAGTAGQTAEYSAGNESDRKGGEPGSGSVPAGAARERGVDSEIARQRGPGGFTGFVNPDELAARKGLEVYDRMMTDAQVRMAVNYKRFAVISADWDVLPGGPSRRDAEIAAFAKRSLELMRGSVVQTVFGVMNALVHGYSVSEMVFKPVESGEDAGRWRLDAIKPKHPRDYEFELDPFGNLTGLDLIDENGRRAKLPLWKFVVYTYLPEFNRPWGRSDLRAVYKHWWSKDFLLKWWNIYLETYGAPTRVGKYPAGATPESRQADLKRVLRDIVNNTAITIPDDMDIEFISAAGDAGFESAVEYHDRQIVKGILGQTLTSDEGGHSGSYALGSVHAATLEDYVSFLRRDIAESVMSEQVIRRLVDFNFADVESYPTFEWQPRKEKVALASVSDIVALMDAGLATDADRNLLRARVDLPPDRVPDAA
jgi:phage gp29-like protein